jgi:hypothetical protein
MSLQNSGLLAGLSCCKAIAAIHGSVIGRLEGDLCRLTALGANSVKQFSLRLSNRGAAILSCITAISASLGLILEALFSIEFLLAGSENKLLSAVFALQCDVLIHVFLPRFDMVYNFTPDGREPSSLQHATITTLFLSYLGI